MVMIHSPCLRRSTVVTGLLLATVTMAYAADVPVDKDAPIESMDAVEQAIDEASEDLATASKGELTPSTGFINDAYKIGYNLKPVFGGLNSPQGLLEEDDKVKDPAFRFTGIYDSFKGWRNTKKSWNEELGIQFTGHYSTLYQTTNDSLPGNEDTFSAGVLRGTARWELLNRGGKNTGALVATLDHRNSFSDIPPGSPAAASEFGYSGLTGTLYSDISWRVVNFNWQQSLNDGNSGLMIGRYDPNDYMNILGTLNPWTLWSNISVMLDSSQVYGDSSWGVAGGSWFQDKWYFTAGINDANGSVGDSMEFFEGGAEFFKWLELGWSPGKNNRYFKNVHFTAWHVDEREDVGYTSGQGLMFAANWMWGDIFMPYVRAGWSDGAEENKFYDRSVTLGFLYKYRARSDAGGIAVNWGRLPEKYNPGSPDQTTIEAFWRLQFAQNLEVTPSIQYLLNPVNNPDDVLVTSLRMRLTF
jgi:porin